MHRADQRTACITGGVHRRSRRWYGPWRCAWCRHRRPSAGPPAAEGSSSVAEPPRPRQRLLGAGFSPRSPSIPRLHQMGAMERLARPSALGKGPRKRAGDSLQASRRCRPQADQVVERRTALAMRRSQRRAVLLRPTGVGQKSLDPQFQPRRARSARPGQARPPASGTTLVEACRISRHGSRFHAVLSTAHPAGPSLRQKSRSPQLFCKPRCGTSGMNLPD